MGISCSKCCSCNFFFDDKSSQSFLSETDKPQIEISSEEIIEKLQVAKKQLISHLTLRNFLSIDSGDTLISIEESTKGHLIKVNFEIPVSGLEFCMFLDENDRKVWDKLVESSEVFETTKDFSVIHIKYKSQISFSAKEVLIASCREINEEKIITTFTSIPSSKINTGSKVEIFEGGYEILKGIPPTQASLIIHMNIGSTPQLTLLKKITEKIIQDQLSSIKHHLLNHPNR